ncbi:MAG: transcription elongation factor GreA [Bacilli bacterium]|nr:transcription elongation factor GreA [Bacilli bacterium]
MNEVIIVSNKEVYLTNEGLNKLKEELDYLKSVKREEIITALKEARALGDLSENAEYDAARGEQAQVESRIAELEAIIGNAVIIADVKTDKVSIGNNVEIEYVEDKDKEVYSIVGSNEADPFNNKISNESPIARAIIGLCVGDVADVESPNGKYAVKVVRIF